MLFSLIQYKDLVGPNKGASDSKCSLVQSSPSFPNRSMFIFKTPIAIFPKILHMLHFGHIHFLHLHGVVFEICSMHFSGIRRGSLISVFKSRFFHTILLNTSRVATHPK